MAILVVIVSCIRDYKVAGNRILYSWWIILFLFFSFAFRSYYLEKKLNRRPGEGAPSAIDVQNNGSPAASSVSMDGPGESQELHAGQTLRADFAGLQVKINGISRDRPSAEITVAESGQEGLTVTPANHTPIYTNVVDGKQYVTRLNRVGCFDPQWLTIAIEEDGHRVTPQQVDQEQWYLQINGVTIKPQSPNTPDTQIRAVAEVNGQRYGYPSLQLYAPDGVATKESWPLAIGQKEFRVRFVGFLKRVSPKSFPRLEGLQSADFNIDELPKTNAVYKTYVFDPVGSATNQTEVDVSYSIMKLD